MKSWFAVLGLLVAVFAPAADKATKVGEASQTAKASPPEKGFTTTEVHVGKTTFKLPVPKAFVVVGRDEEWSKVFHARLENLAQDPRKGVSFVFTSLTPEHLAHCREVKLLDTGLDCWGTVQNQTADREVDQAAYAKIAAAVTAEFAKNGFDGIRQSIRRDIKDEEFNRILGGLGDPMIVDRNERSLQFIMPSGPKLILGAYVHVEGTLFNIYLQAPKAEAREMMVMMDDWIAEIIKTTKATRK
jgi:hypothetical protein